jgi:phosphoribosyl 1,2-cyclic phosphate phosphodiesterase
MTTTTRLTFLGTGTSTGIPVIGCDCAVCHSADPHDRRTRTSALVEVRGRALLIDTAPELRLQALANNVCNVDAVLYTHAHADHVDGFDDLRRFNELRQAPLNVHCDAFTAALLRRRYEYAFEHPFSFYGGKPDLNLCVFDGPFEVQGIAVTPIPVTHGRWTVNGFRIGGLAYVTDAKAIAPASLDLLRGADTLVVNALRERPHPVHLSLGEALDVIEDVRPRQAFIVHLSHELSHAAASAQLPEHVCVAYDGLRVDVADVVR